MSTRNNPSPSASSVTPAGAQAQVGASDWTISHSDGAGASSASQHSQQAEDVSVGDDVPASEVDYNDAGTTDDAQSTGSASADHSNAGTTAAASSYIGKPSQGASEHNWYEQREADNPGLHTNGN
ncbi:hypothetical protein IAT40_005577 [Kwoniella sp. CBS 6097]